MSIRVLGQSDGRRGASLAAAAILSLSALLAGCAGQDDVVGDRAALSLPTPTLAAQREAPAQVAEPVRIRIPRVGVDAAIDPLELDRKGVLPAPDSTTRTGWWHAGPEPGERGPAVIVGHVDSLHGPGVFFRLDELDRTDRVFVDRADGSTAVFAVERIEQHGKDSFPTEAVYGDTRRPTLRLITCGGTFNDREGRYRDNVIAFARLVR